MRWLQFSSATLLLASAVKAWEWDWAVSGEASMTHVSIITIVILILLYIKYIKFI